MEMVVQYMGMKLRIDNTRKNGESGKPKMSIGYARLLDDLLQAAYYEILT
jgi:hypothetical protein